MAPAKFLLVGNGPYNNRGCEAIVRGTMAILRSEFGENIQVVLGTCAHADTIEMQTAIEKDPLIKHIPLFQGGRRWSIPWWQYHIKKFFCSAQAPYTMLDQFCTDAVCALQIGGDNYTLDYGKPEIHMKLDNYLHSKGVPIVLWGASVGPFESDAEFAPVMYEHLRTLRAIFVRETTSYKYLRQLCIDKNLYKIADPAFAMEPIEPTVKKLGQPLPMDAIGLNLSPLMAKYVTAGNMDEWVKRSVEIVQAIVKFTHRKVLLIPHTTGNDGDYSFLRSVANACLKEKKSDVFFLSANLSAAEIKWVISRCVVFVGARTHATIAAISSGVPTLSLAYSRKAVGLNQDIFGNQNYCIQPSEISANSITERVMSLLTQREVIIKELVRNIPGIRAHAFQSGKILRQLIKY